MSNLEELIFYYLPSFKECSALRKRMAFEVFGYLERFLSMLGDSSVSILETELGVMDLLVDDYIMDLKFSEKKFTNSIVKRGFVQLYRYFVFLKDKEKKKSIKGFCLFSPITQEKRCLSIKQAKEAFSLKKDFSFHLLQ